MILLDLEYIAKLPLSSWRSLRAHAIPGPSMPCGSAPTISFCSLARLTQHVWKHTCIPSVLRFLRIDILFVLPASLASSFNPSSLLFFLLSPLFFFYMVVFIFSVSHFFIFLPLNVTLYSSLMEPTYFLLCCGLQRSQLSCVGLCIQVIYLFFRKEL